MLRKIRGRISKSRKLIVVAPTACEYVRDPKVTETRLAVLSNQDVGLDVPGVNVQANIFPRFAHRSDVIMENI